MQCKYVLFIVIHSNTACDIVLLFTENFPPNITGLQRIMVQLNESKTSQYQVTDDTDDRSNIILSLNNEARNIHVS